MRVGGGGGGEGGGGVGSGWVWGWEWEGGGGADGDLTNGLQDETNYGGRVPVDTAPQGPEKYSSGSSSPKLHCLDHLHQSQHDDRHMNQTCR